MSHASFPPSHPHDSLRVLHLIQATDDPLAGQLVKSARQLGLQFRIEIVLTRLRDQASPRTIESAASLISDLLRRSNAGSPFHLIGFSENCLLTYEIACQLAGYGLSVGSVTIVNPSTIRVDRGAAFSDQDTREGLEALRTANGLYRLFGSRFKVQCFLTKAVRSTEVIERWLPVSLAGQLQFMPLDEEGHDSSPINLAELIDSLNTPPPIEPQASADLGAVIELRRGSGDSTLLLVPGAGDTPISLMALLSRIRVSWPAYGFLVKGFDELSSPYPSAEYAVAMLAEEIQKLPGTLDIHLIGHSMGGLLSLMLAEHLTKRNRRVRSVLIIDSEVPDEPPRWEFSDLEILEEYLAIMKQVAGRSLGVSAEDLSNKSTPEMIQQLHRAMVSVQLASPRSSARSFLGAFRTFGAAVRWQIRREALQGYAGPCSIILAKEATNTELGETPAQVNAEAWRKLLPSATVTVGAGNHISILKPPHCEQISALWHSMVTRT